MNHYSYELHLHTSEVSLCASSSAAEMVRHFKRLGFAGICVTDHYNGNIADSEGLTRAERIARFCRGYDRAFEEGRRVGLSVFLGWEYSYHGTDFLIHGLDREWLLRNEAADRMALPDYLAFVRSEGGIVCHAHPFREAGYIDMIRLLPHSIDAVETLNANRPDTENRRALDYARDFGLPETNGSDIHTTHQIRIAAHRFDRPYHSSGELLRAILAGEGERFDTGLQRSPHTGS